jgi:prolyl oligopeptidase
MSTIQTNKAIISIVCCLTFFNSFSAVSQNKKETISKVAVQKTAEIPTQTKTQTQPKVEFKKFTASEFYKTTSIFGSSINNANTSVLVSNDKTGVFNAFSYPLDGNAPIQLTTSTSDSIFAKSWFPKDERLLYSSDQGGNELNHLFVREIDGAIKDLTPGDKLKAIFISWQHNNDGFFIITNERDTKSFDLYRYSTKDYARELVYTNKNNWNIENISQNGRWLALNHSVSNADSNLYLVDLFSEDKAPQLITKHQGDIEHQSYTFTPDNSQLIYSTNGYGEFSQAWRYDIISEKKSVFYATNWDVSFINYSKDGQYLVVGTNQDARTRIKVINLKTKEHFKLAGMSLSKVKNINFSADSSSIVFYTNADNSPSNLYSYTIGDDQVKRLTNSLNPAMQESDLVKSKVKRFESFDGLKIPGLLYQPLGSNIDNKVPALIWVHGGPGGQSRQGYRATIQHLVNQGYAIFAVNNRGSSGYGKTFFHLDDKKHGEDDLKDIVYGKKYLQTLDWIDSNRIGIIGGSYGGYMTMAALAFTDEFQVGIDIFGVTNWKRTLESIPPWWESFRKSLYDEMGDPKTDGERHKRISPLFHAKNIKRPVLIIQGANDPRVLQIESDEMVSEIRKNNVPVEYILFEDEGHGFTKKANRIKASESYLAFLKKYL